MRSLMATGSKAKIKGRFGQSGGGFRLIVVGVFFVVVLALSFVDFLSNTLELKEGDIAQENVVAPRRIVDMRMTKALQERAANSTAPVYDYIGFAQANANAKVGNLFEALSGLYPEYLNEGSVDSINSVSDTNLSLDDCEYLIRINQQQRNNLQLAINNVLDVSYAGEIKTMSLNESVKNAVSLLGKYKLGAKENEIASSVIRSVLQPNMILNEEATEAARKNARESVYEVVYDAGQTIINRGEKITEHHITLLSDNGIIKRDGIFSDIQNSISIILIIAILTITLVSYLYFFHIEIIRSNKMMVLIVSQLIMMLVIAKLSGYFSVYLIPVSFLTMSLCTVFSPRVAVQTNVFLILFLSVMLQLDIDSVMYLVISGYMGVVYMRQVVSRTDIFKSGILVGAVNISMVLLIALLRNNFTSQVFENAVYGIGSGIVASLLTTATLMLWETIFNIATPFKLLEMSAPGDPLIQKLIAEAPGTYHHSLIVSNMSEIAAKEIGANALLARVGAYYHDIGKAEKAIFFKENQRGEDNPHDMITPEVSAQILKNHVRDGVYLAEKYHIPPEIVRFITTHHGTSEITYFKAEAEESNYEGSETFHYEGELPDTKETSIVMLADSIEAAVRSMDMQSDDMIEEMIERIVDKKIREEQLEISELSFLELKKVKEAFLRVLSGVYHSRVKYPDQRMEEADDN